MGINEQVMHVCIYRQSLSLHIDIYAHSYVSPCMFAKYASVWLQLDVSKKLITQLTRIMPNVIVIVLAIEVSLKANKFVAQITASEWMNEWANRVNLLYHIRMGIAVVIAILNKHTHTYELLLEVTRHKICSKKRIDVEIGGIHGTMALDSQMRFVICQRNVISTTTTSSNVDTESTNISYL